MANRFFAASILKRLSLPALMLTSAIGLTALQSVMEPGIAEETSEAIVVAQAADTLQPVKFTLSWLLQGVDAPLLLAMDRGYFAAEGLEVKFERGYGSASTASTLAAGQYDIGFGDMYSMLEFNQENPEDKLVAVAVAFNKAPFALIALEENGITSIEDMMGKTLGAPVGDAPRRLWPVLAEEVGVNAEGVEWVSMEPKLRQAFLLQGNVDAISGFSYSMMPALVAGGRSLDDLNIFYYTENGLDFYGNVILVKESYLESNPDVVRGFIKAYIQGMQDTLRDPATGLEAVMAAGDDLMEEEAEKLRLQIALDGLLVSEEVEQNGLGAIDPARLERTIAQTVKGFALPETPTLEEVFNDSFLPPMAERMLPPATERQPLE